VKAGFTLIEVLIAAAITAVVAGVLLSAHVQTLRTEQTVRTLAAARFQAERIFMARRVGGEPASIQDEIQGEGWIARREKVGAGSLMWERWELAPSNQPLASTVIYLQADQR
jgi:prepilin-type N-terminal cleavage/methylation domain-containing protein